MHLKTIAPNQLPEFLKNAGVVIDVRTPAEFRSTHVVGAESLPLDTFNAQDFVQSRGLDTPVYILCQSGKRATLAGQRLIAVGQREVFVVEGGTDAAIEAGINVEFGQQVISIERQVRIAAGMLVFFGTLAGVVVHVGFFIVPAFVGAGLTFSGITDTCGMGLLLSKMPWNR
ncbi:MAG: rhodanese-related sulfurtransferase [Lentimonas sp.]|jgi:rhodanese-related sulfurtransferase